MATEVTIEARPPVARATDEEPIARVRAALVTPNAIAVAVLMLFVGGAYLALTWKDRAPSIYWDEAGLLGNARWLVGGKPWAMGQATPFQLGYPMLIAPIFAFVHSPVEIYRALMALNALLCALLAGLLYLMARKLVHAEPKVALGTSLVACAYPAVAVHAGIAWTELPAIFAVALFVMTGWWMLERPGYPTMLGHAAVAVYLWLLHGRFIAVPAVFLVLLAYVAVRNPALRRRAIVTGGITVAALIAGEVLQKAVIRSRWDPGAGKPPTLHRILQGIPVALTRQVFGQTFYILVATMGIAAIGVVVLARAFADAHDLPGPHARPLEARVGSIYMLATFASVILVSSATMAAGDPDRFNFSGRYSDPLAPTLFALGLAALLGHRYRRVVIVRSLWIATVVILALGLGVVGINRTRGGFDVVRWVTAPALRPFFAGGTGFGADSQNRLHSDTGILLLTLAATVVVALVALATARRRRWSIAAVVMSVFLVVGVVDVRFMSKSAANARRGTAAYAAMRARHPQTIAYDLDNWGWWSFYGMPYWLNESTFVGYHSSAASWPKADMYIGPPSWPAATRRGLHLLLVDPLSRRGVWVG